MMLFWIYFIPATTLFVVLFFWILELFFQRGINHFRIEEHNSLPNKREIVSTLANGFVFALIGFLMDYLIENNFLHVQINSPETLSDYLLLILMFFCALALHDFYFYWSHRLLHVKYMFQIIHFWHHRSHRVNAWSAFSFHPIEGLVQILIIPLATWILPMHQWSLMVFTFFLLFVSVYGHCGYEFRPNKSAVFHMFNTSLHHAQHHKFVRYNFGIYLNWWDKWFKTENPSYDLDFEKLGKDIQNRKQR